MEQRQIIYTGRDQGVQMKKKYYPQVRIDMARTGCDKFIPEGKSLWASLELYQM